MTLTKKQAELVEELRDALTYALENLDGATNATDDTAPAFLAEVQGWADAAADDVAKLIKLRARKRTGEPSCSCGADHAIANGAAR